jgi:hypothetical protein
MAPPSENQVVAKQRETLQTAIQQLREKLDAYQSQLSGGLEALRDEVQMLARQIDAAGEEAPVPALEVHADENASGQQHATLPFGDAPATVTAEPSEFDFARTAAGPSAPAGTDDMVDTDDMDEVLLGPALAGETHYGDRSELIQGIYQNDDAALSLVGQVMIFRGASPERRPQLLKEIGEAFYRWRGAPAMGDDDFRDYLVAYLVSECEASGVPITVELVQVGDRYDSKRHQAKQRGVEVAGVEGWVVLRGSGRVYTKATVVLK